MAVQIMALHARASGATLSFNPTTATYIGCMLILFGVATSTFVAEMWELARSKGATGLGSATLYAPTGTNAVGRSAAETRKGSTALLGRVYQYAAPEGMSPEDLMECFNARFGRSPLVDDPFFAEPGPYIPEDISEWFLHRQLVASGLLTNNPAEASVFVVNVMPVISLTVDYCNDWTHKGRQEWWAKHLQTSPWFANSNGDDHVFICGSWACMPQDYKIREGSWFGNRMRSAVLVVLRKFVNRMTYWIHEDQPEWTLRVEGDRVSVIPYVAHSGLSDSENGRQRNSDLMSFAERHFRGDTRKHRILFMGSLTRGQWGKVNWRAPLQTVQRPGLRVLSSGVAAGSINKAAFFPYVEEIRDATFCLIVSGDTASSRRLFDAVLGGCIPVFIGPIYTLPFESTLDWQSFTLRLNSSNWLDNRVDAELAKLDMISPIQIRVMRDAMARAAPSIDWRHGTGVLQALLNDWKLAHESQEMPGQTRLWEVTKTTIAGLEVNYTFPSTVAGWSTNVIIGVLSSSTALGKKRRQVIRKTWANGNRVLFLVASPTTDLFAELEQHQDLFILHLPEAYRAGDSVLPVKSQAFFHMVRMKIKSYKYLLKTDDDSFIQVDRLTDRLRATSPDYWGLVVPAGVEPNRDPGHIWYVSMEQYPEPRFPAYCQGWGYAMSRKFVECAVAKLPNSRYSPNEDVATGILARACNVTATHDHSVLEGFTRHYLAGLQQGYKHKHGSWTVLHHVKSSEAMIKLYEGEPVTNACRSCKAPTLKYWATPIKLCVDNPKFHDKQGFSCKAWKGYDCWNDGYLGWDATHAVRTNCCKSCGLKEELGAMKLGAG